MISETTPTSALSDLADAPEPTVPKPDAADPAGKETGGRDGPDPTRYGDWEKNGRCIDF